MQSSTVMGPASGSSKGIAPTDPPIFHPEVDLQEWRRDVARWVNTISAAAKKGTDKLYQTTFATLSLQLYDRALPAAQKSIVDEAKAKKLVNLEQDDQVQAVKQIVDLVAEDPPIAVVSRLISSFNAVTSCRRKGDEDLNSFVSRFRGLAADHLMHAGVSSSSQVGEVLAITLLNNAKLSEETLTNAKLQLIALSQAREDSSSSLLKLSNDSRTQLEQLLSNMKSVLESDDTTVVESDSQSQLADKLVKVTESFTSNVTTLQQVVDRIKDDNKTEPSDVGSKLLKLTPRCRLNLDDAVTVIRNISFSHPGRAKSMTKDEIENLVGQRVQKALLAFSQKSTATTQKGRERKRASVIPAPSTRQSKKPRTSRRPPSSRPTKVYCYDCGEEGHMRQSPLCKKPSFMSRKIMARTKKAEGVSNNDRREDSSDGADDQDFQKGSSPMKRKHA